MAVAVAAPLAAPLAADTDWAAATVTGAEAESPGAFDPAGAPAADTRASLPPWELNAASDDDPVGWRPTAPSRPPWEDATPDGPSREVADPVASVPPEPARQLADAFARAAGVTAVAQAMASAREAQAARLTGWPAGRLLRGRRDPVRALRGSSAAADDRVSINAAVGQAQQSEVDNAVTAFAGAAGGKLPEPWVSGVRDAVRGNDPMIPQALQGAVRGATAEWVPPPGWWRLVTVWQWLLTLLAIAGVVLAVVIGVVRATGHRQGWISEAHLIPWLLLMALAMLVLGYVTAISCRNLAVTAAARERETAEKAMLDRVTSVTRELVLVPAGREIAQYERFRQELAVAAGPRRLATA